MLILSSQPASLAQGGRDQAIVIDQSTFLTPPHASVLMFKRSPNNKQLKFDFFLMSFFN